MKPIVIFPRHLKISLAFFTNTAAAWFVAMFVSSNFQDLLLNGGLTILSLWFANKIEKILEEKYEFSS